MEPEPIPPDSEPAQVIPDFDPEVEVVREEPAPRPVVIVSAPTDRNRGLAPLFWPLLLLVGAGGLLWVRAELSDWRGLVIQWGSPSPAMADRPPVGETGPTAVAEPAEPKPTAQAEAEPESEPMPEPVEVAVVPTEPAPSPDPVEPPPADPGVAGASLFLAPLQPEEVNPPGLPQAVDVWDGIRREAADRKAELEELERLKAEADELGAQVDARRAAERADEANQARGGFLDELKQALDQNPARQAEAIRRLVADQPHRGPFLNADQRQRALSLSRARTLRFAWAARLRSLGVDEATILKDLAEAHKVNVAARGGPDDEDEAYIFAARELLAVPQAPAGPLSARVALPSAAPRIRPEPPPVDSDSRFGFSRRR